MDNDIKALERLEETMGEKALRSGFTTGTCAAAAAWAAVCLLCSGTEESRGRAALPGGQVLTIPVAGSFLDGGHWASCFVRKNSGDDPDVTDKVRVCARAVLVSEKPAGQPCYDSEEHPGIYVTGGDGIGMVTRKGLSCPVGCYAINPVPRKMIFEAADEARRRFDCQDMKLLIEISIPEGKMLAEKTFNPSLGITGGISVLGTTGIVNPMSEAALTETIRLDIRVRAAEGRKILAVAPGNYGEHFLKEELGLNLRSFVKCSNFIGDTFRMMEEEKIERALLAGHIGKLIKTAGGVMNTHSKYGDRRMEILAQCALAAGVKKTVTDRLYQMNTTEEAVGYLSGENCLRPVMDTAAERVKRNLEAVCRVETEVILFSQTMGLLSGTEGAGGFAQELKNQEYI